jgi:hypothetical protein
MVFRRFPVAAPRVAGRRDMKSNPCASSAIKIFYKQIRCVEGKKTGGDAGQYFTFLFYLFRNREQKCLIQARVIALR